MRVPFMRLRLVFAFLTMGLAATGCAPREKSPVTPATTVASTPQNAPDSTALDPLPSVPREGFFEAHFPSQTLEWPKELGKDFLLESCTKAGGHLSPERACLCPSSNLIYHHTLGICEEAALSDCPESMVESLEKAKDEDLAKVEKYHCRKRSLIQYPTKKYREKTFLFKSYSHFVSTNNREILLKMAKYFDTLYLKKEEIAPLFARNSNTYYFTEYQPDPNMSPYKNIERHLYVEDNFDKLYDQTDPEFYETFFTAHLSLPSVGNRYHRVIIPMLLDVFSQVFILPQKYRAAYEHYLAHPPLYAHFQDNFSMDCQEDCDAFYQSPRGPQGEWVSEIRHLIFGQVVSRQLILRVNPYEQLLIQFDPLGFPNFSLEQVNTPTALMQTLRGHRGQTLAEHSDPLPARPLEQVEDPSLPTLHILETLYSALPISGRADANLAGQELPTNTDHGLQLALDPRRNSVDFGLHGREVGMSALMLSDTLGHPINLNYIHDYGFRLGLFNAEPVGKKPVFSLSMVFPYDPQTCHSVMRHFFKGNEDRLLVAGMGNEGREIDFSRNWDQCPGVLAGGEYVAARAEALVTVAAPDLEYTSWSTRYADLMADGTSPGNRTGTSFAAPRVAAVATLLRREGGTDTWGLPAWAIRYLLMVSVDVLPGWEDKIRSGGIVNPQRALGAVNTLRHWVTISAAANGPNWRPDEKFTRDFLSSMDDLKSSPQDIEKRIALWRGRKVWWDNGEKDAGSLF